MQRKHIKKCGEFPKINKRNHTVASPQTTSYNCIAFAAGVTTKKWWPAFHPDAYWPPGCPYSDSIASFVQAFQTLGYTVCADGKYEEGFEKIALYAKFGAVKHAARLVAKGKWASKLGDLEDIVHEETAVAGGLYGEVVQYMRRTT